jgi:hypothetical protein
MAAAKWVQPGLRCAYLSVIGIGYTFSLKKGLDQLAVTFDSVEILVYPRLQRPNWKRIENEFGPVRGFDLALQGGGMRFAVGLQGTFKTIGQTHLIVCGGSVKLASYESHAAYSNRL